MRTCEYCGMNTDTIKENCPACNAPLPPLPARPPGTEPDIFNAADRIITSDSPAARQDYRSRVLLAAVCGLSILGLFLVALNPRDQRTPSVSSTTTFLPPPAPVDYYEEETADAEPEGPQTLESRMSNPALRQIVELYFGREISKLTNEDLASIQFLALMGDTAYVSEQSLSPPAYLEQELDRPEVTAIRYDSSWSDGTSLDCLTGLKTLSFTGMDGAVANIPPLEGLERLVIYSGADVNDFTAFHKFPNLSELTVSGGDFNSYSGLSELNRLEKLGLYATGLTDLGVLSEMTNIKSLALYQNEDMSGIQTLEAMNWLTELIIFDVPYTDLNMIGSLKELERLTVAATPVKSLTFLEGLTRLKYLRLSQNDQALIIPPLAGMSQLEEIFIDCRSTEDVSYLDGLSGVKKAVLYGPGSLEPLRSYTSLQDLWLEMGWLLTDLSPLGSLSELESLRLYGRTYQEVNGISAIGNLSQLKILNVDGMDNFVRFDFLSDLTGLEELHMSQNTIFGDFSGIGNLSNLRELYLSEVTIHDSYERIDNNGIVDIYYYGDRTIDEFADELSKLTKLEVLELNRNKELLTTLSFTADMPELRILWASDNYITDVSPLAGLTGLEYADLSQNAVADWRVLDSLIDTEIIR